MMKEFPVFLSVVIVVKNIENLIASQLEKVTQLISPLVSDYELVVIDNASTDDTLVRLKHLTQIDGLANLQVYALTKEVDVDTAAWAGLENALGDFVAVIDLLTDDSAFLPKMLDKAVNGFDVIFAFNQRKPRQSLAYRIGFAIFNYLYERLNGVHLSKEAPHYRMLSRRAVNFILQHSQPALTYRHLPATSGFSRVNMEYSAELLAQNKKKLGESISRGIRLLVSTTRAPMRLVTSLSLLGAVANLIYSFYVVMIGFVKADVAPGWVSISLQQSGMFFLISLVLLVLGEYILHMADLSHEGPLYHVAQEFTSARIIRREKLNIEEVAMPPIIDIDLSNQANVRRR